MRNGKRVRQAYQAAARLARLGGDSCFDLRIVVHRCERHRHTKGRGVGLDLMVEQWGEERGVWVEDDGDAGEAGRYLLQQLQPLSHQRRVIGAESRNVAAGPRETLNKTLA